MNQPIYPASPRFSIITPTLNQGQYLGRTAQGILQQSGPGVSLEWIVMDGGSRDQTLELLDALAQGDSRIRLRSEPDRGQADAINKGLALAGGEIVAWLNSDDVYQPGALAEVAATFGRHPDAQWLVGRCRIIDAGDRPIRSMVARYKDWRLAHYSRRALLRENFIAQPAVFWRRGFGQSAGPLDTRLHWAMDYDLWLRMAALSEPLILDRPLASFRLHRSSKTGRFDRRQFDEQYAVASRHFGADRASRVAHKLNIEKIVAAYRMMRL